MLVQIGMCTGMLQRKRPTAVGQADYYGVVANTAARIMGQAKPGQVLLEGNLPFTHGDPAQCRKVHYVHVHNYSSGKSASIELHPHGFVKLKGLEQSTPVFRVWTLHCLD
jgi:class 3 adenylate cyclase